MRQALLINGVPASGKSTIAASLIPQLQAAGVQPVPLGLDTVKEALFAQIGTGNRDYNRMLGRASYHAIFNSIAGFPDGLLPVIDAWHGFQPREVLEAHLKLARIDRVLELWVGVRPDTAAARYRARSGGRHSGHLPETYAEELAVLAERAGPMGFGPVMRVDSESAMPGDLAQRLVQALAQPLDREGELAEER